MLEAERDSRKHVAEIAEILAIGLMRLLARKSSPFSADGQESSLHISPAKSGHPDLVVRREPDD
jgi:hypothetical protein